MERRRSRRTSFTSNSIFCDIRVHMKTHAHTSNVLRMRYACVTHRSSAYVFKSREQRDNTRVNSLRQPYGLLQPLFPSTHHFGFPILGRSSINIRFTVVTIKLRELFVLNAISSGVKKQNENRTRHFLINDIIVFEFV